MYLRAIERDIQFKVSQAIPGPVDQFTFRNDTDTAAGISGSVYLGKNGIHAVVEIVGSGEGRHQNNNEC